MIGYDTSHAELKVAQAKVQALIEARTVERDRIAANLERVSLLLDKDALYLAHIEALLEESRERHHRALASPVRDKPHDRCVGLCEKMRFDSREAASKFCAKRTGRRMRCYWDSKCKCWHTTSLPAARRGGAFGR